ncbi:hypothetical protein IE81DRAFT_71914 [Ceraceosorus guamensis]|uniref:Uncharacterized protein n=1 Tax=Ceraceosorus guamensis TaxID=1522189 RepID=A0A316W1M4_9BASI|nr:hypothetical protein IE81DRAFT_71914 [Ceraceosorus guamensis]PWN43589.1 hypothetical protein IE81DRAFT_71914 [Ceraceosorus guamensis]
MRRTAAAIRSSSTPSVLEMRILANHGGDHRFSFLRRGEEKRWGVEWERLLRGENVQLPASTPQASLLSGYDSESGSDAGRTDEGHEVQLTANRAVERKADAHSGSGKQASIPAQASEMSQEPQEEPKQEAEPADAAQSSATSGREILRAERSGTQKASRLAKARAWALQHRAQTESAKESVGNDAPAEKAQLAEIGDGVND